MDFVSLGAPCGGGRSCPSRQCPPSTSFGASAGFQGRRCRLDTKLAAHDAPKIIRPRQRERKIIYGYGSSFALLCVVQYSSK